MEALKKTIAFVSLLALLASQAFGGLILISPPPRITTPVVYSTTFSTTENPLSESGTWITGLATGLDWKDPLTSSGNALPSGFNAGPPYNDSLAHLNSSAYPVAANQYATATIFRAGGYDPATSHEVELLLRFALTSHNARGYEVLFSLTFDVVSIVRWNGPLDDFTELTNTGITKPANGDVVYAQISGNTITVKINGNTVLTTNDSTWSTGQPGAGFWVRSGDTSLTSYGFTNWTGGSL